MIPEDLLEMTTEKLKEYRYVAKCVTCQQVFFNVNLAELKDLFTSGAWIDTRPMNWYIEAGYHWVENQDHVICIVLVYPSGQEELYYQLSEQWKSKLQYEPVATKQAMLNELKYLEKQLEETTEQCSSG